MNEENKKTGKRFLQVLKWFLLGLVVIIANAGAINYGVHDGNGIYAVAGVIALVFGGWCIYKDIKAHPEDYK